MSRSWWSFVLMPGCFLFGGGHADEREVCERWLDCVTALDPESAAAAVALYGEDSACWGSADDAVRCATACEESLAAADSADPACAPVDDSDDTDVVTRSLLDEPITWGEIEVAVDSPESCEPATVVDALTTTPTGGAGFELAIYFNGANPSEFDCTADGVGFECEDFPGPPAMVNASGSVDADASNLSFEFNIGASPDDLCGQWTFSAVRQ